MNYSRVCTHPEFRRIDKNVIKCTHCGQDMINQLISKNNKCIRDFAREDKTVKKEFDRHFTNKDGDQDAKWGDWGSESYSEIKRKKKRDTFLDKGNRIRLIVEPYKHNLYRINLDGEIYLVPEATISHLIAKLKLHLA